MTVFEVVYNYADGLFTKLSLFQTSNSFLIRIKIQDVMIDIWQRATEHVNTSNLKK